jgi:MoaA/NifB/PqqE/SkfB family radical SAM enzyme
MITNQTRQKWNDFVMKNKLLTWLYVKYMQSFVHNMKRKDDKNHLKFYKRKGMFDWVAIETTDICTRRCEYCPLSQSPRKNFLDEIIFYRILNELKEINYRGKICFSNYGGPLVDERLPIFVRKTREYFPDLFINMSTNGDLLTPEKFREIIDAGMNEICITQHGDIEPNNHRRLKLELTDEEKKHIIWINLNKDSLLSNRGGTVEVNSKRIAKKICYQTTLIIRADATITLCCHDYFGEITLGDLKKKSIMDIWDDSKNIAIRKNLYNGFAVNTMCKKCYLFQEAK